jgi:signal peptidase I
MNNLLGDMSTALLCSGHEIRFRATGHSMQPTIEDGEVITVAPITPTAAKRGDILLYQSECGVKAHRVVGIRRSAKGEDVNYFMRGDASMDHDDPVRPEQVLGLVVTVERKGRRIDLTSRRAKWLHAARACASQVTHWLRG